MISIRSVFFILIGLNIMAISLITLNRYEGKTIANSIPLHTVNLQGIKDIRNPYAFDDPFKAFYLLEKLDVFEAINPQDIPGSNFTSTGGAFTVNFDYCNEHRAYFVNHPESIFEENKFLTNYWKNHKIRSQVINKMGKDVLPGLVPQTSYPTKFDMTVDTGIFFIRNLYFYWRQVGKQFACLTQAFNHIPGHDKIYRKDAASQALVEYAKTYQSRPQCFNYDKHFPKTWVLKDKESCLDFFEEFNSPRYQDLKRERNVVYFRKIGADVHQGHGVFPVTEKEEEHIRTLYENGTLCGKVKDNNLIQYNVWNSLLVQKRKPGFRVFMLIASTNPVIAYYHDGYVRLSLNEYDLNSNDTGTFVTNIHVNLQEAQSGMNAFQGMTEAQINEHTCWFYDRFHNYLLEQGFVTDPDWIENYLRTEFKKVMIHLVRMAQSGFAKKSSVYELYGLDFVMDENLNVWYIEGNAMPLIDGFTPDSTKLMNTMLADSFEIVFSLIRSRAKRIILYINELSKETDGLDIPDLQQKREEFRELTKNRFEPEFELSPNNTFHKIVDDNESGIKRYAGLLEEECL